MKEVKVYSLIFVALLYACTAKSQISGTKNIPGDYATLAAAINDLNTQGAGSGGVTLNLIASNPQTTPAGGYSITATGTAGNPIIITGNSNTVTAPAGQVAGNLNDAIFKIIGGDYITIQGFTMLENGSNMTTAAGTNNMTEFGVALFYASTTNGAQNNTIQNNTITLNRMYQNTFGIYSNVRHTATSVTTAADIVSSVGSNSNNKLYSNNISNVNLGMVFVGSLTGDYMDTGLDIGGNSLSTGNTISNYGTTGTFSGYQSVSGTVNGINVNNQLGCNISYNSVTSSNGGVTVTGTIRGIYCQVSGTLPTSGSYTRTINNNSISVKGGNAANTIHGITHDNGNLTISLSISNNDFHDFDHVPGPGSGAVTFINAASATVKNIAINGNTFTSMTLSTTGGVTFISKTATHPTNAIISINNNSIVTQFTKSGVGGTVTGYISAGASPSSVTETNNNNNFSNITATGSGITLWSSQDGGSVGITKTVNNNVFTNIAGGVFSITILASGNGYNNSVNTVSGNLISGISGQGSIIGYQGGTVSAGTVNFTNNTIHGLSSSGATAGVVTGVEVGNGLLSNFYNNKIYDIQSNGTGGTVNGILVSTGFGVTVNIFNNLIGDLRTPSSSGTALTGINITSNVTNVTVNVSFNTIYINQSSPSGTNFGSSGISHTANTTATNGTLVLRNNIVVNSSAFTGTGLTVAYRRTGTTLNNYSTLSNNNLLYAGTPGSSNLIFNDGTNSDQTIAAFKTRMGTRDGNSVTESPSFLSSTGSSPNFLHIDASIATQIESGGTNVGGITTDFDGDSRNANFPDIGADEIAGIGNDVTGPVIQYAILSSTSSTGNRTIVATITDVSGVAAGGNSPLIYYRKGTSGAYFSSVATSINGNDYTFTIDYANVTGGSVAAGDIIQYYFAAQDVPTNLTTSPSGGSGTTPPGSTPPSIPNQYKIIQSYTWQGGTNDFQLAGNWSPSRNTPDVSDILVFDGAVTASSTANNIPVQTISKLVAQNSINLTLNAAVAGNTLTLDYGTGQIALDIQSGSTVNQGTATALNLAFGLTQPNQIGTIAGTLNLNQASGLTVTNGVISVSGAIGMNATSAVTGSNTTNFQFLSGGFMNYAKSSGTVPTATYTPNSTINITGVIGTAISLPSTPNNIFGNLTWNCPGQTNNFSLNGATINGTLLMLATNTGTVTFLGAIPIAGNATVNGGTCAIGNNSAVNIAGALLQNGGTITKLATSTATWNAGSINQAAGTLTGSTFDGLFTLNATSGDMSFAGTVNAGTGTTSAFAFGFSATGNQTLTTNGATILNKLNIVINKTSGNCTLASDLTINSGAGVTLTNGKFTIAAGKTLTISAGASVSGVTSTNYIVTAASGANLAKLKYAGLTTGAQSFGIGTPNNYMPVTITPITTGSSFAAGVFEGATVNGAPNGTLIGAPDIDDIVNAGWQIDNSVVSTAASINLSWASSQEGSNFTSLSNGQIGILRYNGSGYDIGTGSGDNSANTASSTFSSFSPFIVGKISNSCVAGTTATWTGTIDNDYNKPGNWNTGCVPTATMDIIIPSVTNAPTLTGSVASVRNVTMQAGAILNLDNGSVLNIKGDFVNDGMIVSGGSPSNGKTVFNGTVAQNISGSGVYSHVEIDNSIDVIVLSDISVQTIQLLPGAVLTVTPPRTLNVLQ